MDLGQFWAAIADSTTRLGGVHRITWIARVGGEPFVVIDLRDPSQDLVKGKPEEVAHELANLAQRGILEEQEADA